MLEKPCPLPGYLLTIRHWMWDDRRRHYELTPRNLHFPQHKFICHPLILLRQAGFSLMTELKLVFSWVCISSAGKVTSDAYTYFRPSTRHIYIHSFHSRRPPSSYPYVSSNDIHALYDKIILFQACARRLLPKHLVRHHRYESVTGHRVPVLMQSSLAPKHSTT